MGLGGTVLIVVLADAESSLSERGCARCRASRNPDAYCGFARELAVLTFVPEGRVLSDAMFGIAYLSQLLKSMCGRSNARLLQPIWEKKSVAS